MVALYSVFMVYIGVFILYLHTRQVTVGQKSIVGTVTCYGLVLVLSAESQNVTTAQHCNSA